MCVCVLYIYIHTYILFIVVCYMGQFLYICINLYICMNVCSYISAYDAVVCTL